MVANGLTEKVTRDKVMKAVLSLFNLNSLLPKL